MEVIIKGKFPKLDTIITKIREKRDKYIIKAHLTDENENSIPYTFYTTNHIQSPIIYVINTGYAKGFIMPSPPKSKKCGNISKNKPISLDDFILVIGYNPKIPIPYYIDFKSLIVARTRPEIHFKEGRIVDEISFEGNCAANIVEKIEEYNSYVLHLEEANIDSLINYLWSITYLVDIINAPKNRLYRYGWFIDVIDENACENYELYPLRMEVFEIFGFANF